MVLLGYPSFYCVPCRVYEICLARLMFHTSCAFLAYVSGFLGPCLLFLSRFFFIPIPLQRQHTALQSHSSTTTQKARFLLTMRTRRCSERYPLEVLTTASTEAPQRLTSLDNGFKRHPTNVQRHGKQAARRVRREHPRLCCSTCLAPYRQSTCEPNTSCL